MAGFRPNSEIIVKFRKLKKFYGHFIKRQKWSRGPWAAESVEYTDGRNETNDERIIIKFTYKPLYCPPVVENEQTQYVFPLNQALAFQP